MVENVTQNKSSSFVFITYFITAMKNWLTQRSCPKNSCPLLGKTPPAKKAHEKNLTSKTKV
jgi:hypothetical protein